MKKKLEGQGHRFFSGWLELKIKMNGDIFFFPTPAMFSMTCLPEVKTKIYFLFLVPGKDEDFGFLLSLVLSEVSDAVFVS